MQNLKVDRDRLWASLMELAKIGATPKGGVARIALTDLDRQGRDLFVRWAREAGCEVRIDSVGNIFARRRGRDDSLPPVMTGSHLDSQPTGGKFDGAYGVMAGLEVIRTLNDLGYETLRPIEVVAWTNEEGCRFAPAMMGSGVWVGKFDEADIHERTDEHGLKFGEELKKIGYLGSEPAKSRPVAAFFEAHIEQGPILEAEGKTIGVVQGAQGQRWFDVTVTGQEAHAGPTPMKRRRDALVGASRIIDAVNRIGLDNQPGACATVGHLEVRPNSRNTIPGQVFFTVDFRHPDDAVLLKMRRELEAAAETVCRDLGLELDLKEIWHQPALKFDPECVAAVKAGAEAAGLPHMDIISGAGHDACHMATIAPTAMIFVPCREGVSHNEAEDATPEHVGAGCDVLLHAIVARANAA